MKRRAQAAMEFLMTYGWAILVVLLAIGALAYFGVLDPSRLLPESTTFPAPISNVDNGLIDDVTNSVEVALVNNKGVAITLPLTGSLTPDAGTTCVYSSVSATYNGAAVVANTTQIPQGATFLITFDCTDLVPTPAIGTKYKATMAFDYTNTQTGQTRSHIGTVQGRYE
ncbi:MAG: hypothetical protein KC535_03220 [Nanoarchaeota archaeon]|nr:hypothetical protein [Nanoarchaeota archaeon]